VTAGPADESFAALQRVTSLCELGRYDDAVTVLRPIVALDPQDSKAWCLLAQASLGSDEPESALHAAAQALSLIPDEEWPHRLASLALAGLGRHDEAMREAREAVRTGPYIAESFIRLAAELSRKKSGLAEARTLADRALSLAPEAADSHISVGAVAAKAGRKKDAERAFREALALEPQDAVAHNELARLHLGRSGLARPGALAEAAGGFASAVRADPRAEVSRLNLDLVLRAFLSKVSYFVLLDVWVAGQATLADPRFVVRLVPTALLAVPGAFAWRFIGRLSPDLRSYLWRLIVASKTRFPFALNVFALVLVVAATVAPHDARPGLAVSATAAALIARVWLLAHVERGARPPRRLNPMAALGLGVLWVIASLLAIATVVCFAAAAGGGSLVVGLGLGVLFALGSVGVGYLITKRSSTAWRPAVRR
jgi:Flp pilus assembly protein TadD